MKKKKTIIIIAILLVMTLMLGVSSFLFVNGVNRQLWIHSIRTITETIHQGANSLNIQLKADFDVLEMIKTDIVKGDSSKVDAIMDSYNIVEPDVNLYICDNINSDNHTNHDREVCKYLDKVDLERGVLDSHISSLTGERVFNIFERIYFEDKIKAYLVKEYRTKEIAEQFTLTFYNYKGFSYLINRDGTVMVRSGHKNSNKTLSNLFDLISLEQNEIQMIEEFKNSIYKLKAGWAKFNYNGEGMVFCYEALRADSNWLLVSVIPEKVITQQAESILVKTVLFLGIIVAIILIIVGLFYAVKMQESKVHTTQLQKALKETDAANKVKGQFLMNMSHDVRTPLNTILGMTAIAQKESDDKEKMSECIKKIDIAGKHLLSLVNDVLDMSQIDSGKMILTEEVISLTQLFKKVADMMKIEAKEAKLTIDWTIQLKDEIIIGDSLRIQQVLINIINNAIKYTSEGGHVLLEMIQLEDKVKEGYGTYRFSCTDTGIGMRQDFLERIFLFFERDKNTTLSGVAGTGVGLAITKGILDLMGGSICVKSELNKGSTFTVDFHFKVQKQELQKEQDTIQDVIADSNSQEQTQDYTNKRILLVEDVELNMEIAEELIGTTGVQIDKAYNGKEAVELFSKNPCGYSNLIFMDLQLPVMDGYEATSQIRSLDKPDSKSIPIVALSANALADDIENSLNAGMNEHIAKPIDMEAVWKVLKKYLNE